MGGEERGTTGIIKKKRQTATITYIDDYHLVVATCYYDCIRDTKERYTLQKGCLRCVWCTRSENDTYQHDVVYFILIFNQNDKNVYF